MPNLYILLFLCGRKDKMKFEDNKRAKERKKEAIITNIDNMIRYFKTMKTLYVKDVFYEDHARFLKLIYYIENERAQIDTTTKKHGKYVQGAIARSRRYDRDNMKQLADSRELEVEDDIDEILMKGKKKKHTPFVSTVIKLRK